MIEFGKESIDETYSDDSLLNLISYGIDLSVREIVTMLDEGDLVKPKLQRNYVWNKKEASRFIDSILLGLPVPSLFFAKDYDEKMLIVDGLQRVTTLYDFINGIFSADGTKFKLSNSSIINERWRNYSFEELSTELQRRIKNYSIHAIIFDRKDKQGNDTAMYQIFERINTGGRVLSHQEIRNCVYHGSFNDLLLELSKDERWIRLVGGKNDLRMKNAELVLRIFAIKDMILNDTKVVNLNKYLNEYMSLHRNIDVENSYRIRDLFYQSINFVESINSMYNNNDYHRFALSITESLLESFLIYKDRYEFVNYDNIDLEKIELLKEDLRFRDASMARTTNVSNIKTRIYRCLSIVFGVDNCE